VGNVAILEHTKAVGKHPRPCRPNIKRPETRYNVGCRLRATLGVTLCRETRIVRSGDCVRLPGACNLRLEAGGDRRQQPLVVTCVNGRSSRRVRDGNAGSSNFHRG